MKGRNETLVVMTPNVDAVYNAGIGGWLDPNGYQAFLTNSLLYTSVIDLSGWTKERFTFGTVQSQFQDPGVYTTNSSAGKLEVVDIISQIPLPRSSTQLSNIVANMGSKAPGMLGTDQDFSSIIYGNYRLYVPNTSLGAFPGFLQLLSSSSFGSKEPTAAENLYFYRLVKCVGAPADTLTLPACRIGLFGTFYQEGDNEYMMRLKRSYELQQLVD